MERNGISYVTSREMLGEDWHPDFSPQVVHRELEIIKNDLHCNTVRICGKDIGRQTLTAHFLVGAGRAIFTGRPAIRSGFEMFVVGMGVALVTFLLGLLVGVRL